MAAIAARRQDRAAPAIEDLRDDLGEVLGLARGARRRLRRAPREITAVRRALGGRVYRTQVARLHSAEEAYDRYVAELEHILARAQPESRLAAFKRDYAGLLRMQQGVVAALVTSSDWQSRPHATAGGPGFGRAAGVTREHVDDYKRDRHADAAEFETEYLRAMVNAPDGGVRALMTSCGMAAFTTILQFLICDRVVRGAAALGRSTYHECRIAVRGPGPPDGDLKFSYYRCSSRRGEQGWRVARPVCSPADPPRALGVGGPPPYRRRAAARRAKGASSSRPIRFTIDS